MDRYAVSESGASTDRPGFIRPHALEELWFHTGTACNLRCSFCLEGSKPGDQRLQQPTLAEVKPYIDEAVTLGVRQFSFTGGEPFVNRSAGAMLQYASDRGPCLVLTNATQPLRRRIHEVRALRDARHPLSFRVSLDSPDPSVHDAERGEGNFAYALETMRELLGMGFAVSVARLAPPGEDAERIESAYRALFREHGLPESLRIVRFPDFGVPGCSPDGLPAITENCMTTYHSAESRRRFMCAFSKMIVKREGRMRVYACTLVDDDLRYELGEDLTRSLRMRIPLKHSRCFACFSQGASCSEFDGGAV